MASTLVLLEIEVGESDPTGCQFSSQMPSRRLGKSEDLAGCFADNVYGSPALQAPEAVAVPSPPLQLLLPVDGGKSGGIYQDSPYGTVGYFTLLVAVS